MRYCNKRALAEVHFACFAYFRVVDVEREVLFVALTLQLGAVS